MTTIKPDPVVTEHAVQMSGGGYHVRPSEEDVPGLERIFPLADWIRSEQRFGGKVYRRKVIVIEDWTEVAQEERTEGGSEKR